VQEPGRQDRDCDVGQPTGGTEYGADTRRRAALSGDPAVVRGVPDGLPWHAPPGVRPGGRRRRGARLELRRLRRLRDGVQRRPRRRQQEGRVHARPDSDSRRLRARRRWRTDLW